MNTSRTLIFLLWAVFSTFSSCKKFVEVAPPTTNLTQGNVYTNDLTASAALTGIYVRLSQDNLAVFQPKLSNISLHCGLAADELTLFDMGNTDLLSYYRNDLTPRVSQNNNHWYNIYTLIYQVNSALEGLTKSTALSAKVKDQLIGESYFLRAFFYFYLINLYGDVPLSLQTDYQTNLLLGRTPVSEVYKAIIEDLKNAEKLLSSNYLTADVLRPYPAGSEERVRPNKFAAAALLARAYLYAGDYTNAQMESSKVIENSQYELVNLNNVFLKNSRETIWQLQTVGIGVNSNTGEGQMYVLPDSGPSVNDPYYPVYLNEALVQDFDNGDLRKTNWIGKVEDNSSGKVYYFPNKYKIGRTNNVPIEYFMVLRLAEQYLIRAEAKIMQNNLSGGIMDLNFIRARATDSTQPIDEQLPQLSSSLSQPEALNSVVHERRIELFSEWGHRWMDLKRMKLADQVMPEATAKKGGVWKTTGSLFPIPEKEINKSPNLPGHQNPGY
ncbi:RagB/SusD family nutrient uptake outer membrane protein [Pedobacter sp. GR22-10]|uniref:RagB/SusD family nutrient uptake outer membrane protein n=1 Tax=Pedobacter sp. GR22-10 TaxID=2994472 RepID=UPI00224629F7|nr:RagB/SusD family nutrient uptake outer membrane protein [Pedobacter sp. GR22-10]MCX2430172.1 RagB/SusD family nutrient uptake outer membrane protein [Pedobacter sp. GR22-10]